MMKPEHKDLTPIELALLTWYKPDNLLYRNPEHPTIKLAGEIGELLDLYGKHKYKPGFDWMVCKKCKTSKDSHFIKNNIQYCSIDGTEYVPLVLDELGDIWYYLRILAWIYDIELEELNLEDREETTTLQAIETMYISASSILAIGKMNLPLQSIYTYLLLILEHLNTTIEELTLLNYYKLNSDETNHGWKDAQ